MQVTTAAHLAISAKVVFPERTSLNDGRLSLTPPVTLSEPYLFSLIREQ